MSTSSELDQKCRKTVEHFKKDIQKLRTGRANTGILEGVMVDYYGSMVPLIQVGMINAPEPRLITIQVYDASAVEAVEKAIQQADLGLNPSRDGSLVRLIIPPLNEERRKDMIKKLHKMNEDTKVSIRNHRREVLDAMKKKEKEKEISQDDLRRGETEIQKVTDKYTSELDMLVSAKEKEMLEV